MKKLYFASAFCALALTSCSLFTKDEQQCSAPEPTTPQEQALDSAAPSELSEQTAAAAVVETTRGPRQQVKGGEVSHLSKKHNFDAIIKENQYVVVDFFAEWCGPCKAMGSVLDRTAKDFPNVIILKVNVEEFKDLATRFNVRSIPHLVFYKNGTKVFDNPNSLNAAQFKAKIEALLAK